VRDLGYSRFVPQVATTRDGEPLGFHIHGTATTNAPIVTVHGRRPWLLELPASCADRASRCTMEVAWLGGWIV